MHYVFIFCNNFCLKWTCGREKIVHGVRHVKWNMQELTQSQISGSVIFVCCFYCFQCFHQHFFLRCVQLNIQYVKLKKVIFKNLENGNLFLAFFFILFQKKNQNKRKQNKKGKFQVKDKLFEKKYKWKKTPKNKWYFFCLWFGCRHHLHAKCCLLFSIVVTVQNIKNPNKIHV